MKIFISFLLMDHIFGKSDDISFGNTSSSFSREKEISRPFSPRPTRPQSSQAQPPRDTNRPPRKPQSSQAPIGRSLDETPALERLVQSMKSSFLPTLESPLALRVVPLSSANVVDPLFLIRRDDTTILIGSAIAQLVRAGKSYLSFPDMRLPFSEKDRLRGWILLDDSIDVQAFVTILPLLGFPPIYATRSVIAKFRNTITDQTFLDSCRFFELFPDDLSERRIGDIVFLPSVDTESTPLACRVGKETLSWTRPGTSLESGLSIVPHDSAWKVGDLDLVSGEILVVQDGSVQKQSLKYTFDTFYIDGSSVGVVAGYTLGDREMLAENGVLTFTLEEDTRARTISGHIFIDSRGFVHSHEMLAVHKEILK